MHSLRVLLIAAAALALVSAGACTREEPEDELSPAIAESGAAGTGVGHGGPMTEPGTHPPGGMGMYGEGEHMTLEQMREHVRQMHGRVEHMMTAPHMSGDWTEMSRHMADLDQSLERMIEQMRRMESDPAAAPRVEAMRRHMTQMLRSYEAMVEGMETPPPGASTPTPPA